MSRLPPLHIPICIGPIQPRRLRKLETEAKEDDSSLKFCHLCNKIVTQDDKKFVCFNEGCDENFHVVCLGRHFQSSNENFLIPVEGLCPCCSTSILWGDVIRYASGCYRKSVDCS